MTSLTLGRTAPSTLSDKQQYHLMFAATFLIFLAAVAAKRIARWAGGMSAPAGTPKSIFAEARAAGSSALLFAFMG